MKTQMKQQAKKEWAKPELTVLVRNNAEEAVLAFCKGDGNSADVMGDQGSCRYGSAGCASCNQVATS